MPAPEPSPQQIDLTPIRTVLAAYCSTGAHITEEQITAAWAAFDSLAAASTEPAREDLKHHPYTIAEVEELLPQAKKVAAALKVSEAEAPLFLGFVSTDPIPESALKRGEELAKEHGW